MFPVLTSSTPVENQSRLAVNRDIVLTFNVAMLASVGSITLSDGASQTYVNKQGVSVTRLVNATDTRTISILDSSQVTIVGNTVTLHLNTALKSGLAYSLQIDSGALTDATGGSFTGLRDAAGLRFTTLPAATPLALVDAALHFIDSGSNASDYLTNVAAQSFSGTYSGRLAAGEFVEVSLDNGLHWSRATVATGTWRANGVISASDTVLARVSNSDGLSSTAAAQSYIFDTAAPQLAGGTYIDLSNTTLAPGATALVTVAFSEKVTLSASAFIVNGGALTGIRTLDGGYTWSASLIPQVGSGTITLNLGAITDLAGNTGVGLISGPSYNYGTVTPVLAQVSAAIHFTDSGSSASDYITNVVAQTIHGSYSGSLAGGDAVEVSTDNGATWHNATADAGVWSYATDIATSSIMQARMHRAGGNVGDTVSQAYVLDTTAPTVVVDIKLDHSYITTNQTATVNVTFSEKMTQLGAGTITANAGTLSAFTSSDGGTTWSATLTPPAGQIGEGGLTLHHNLFYDLAGNAGSDTVSGADYTYNTVPVALDAPAPLLAAGSDRGLSNTDNKTSGAVTITGSTTAGVTVKLYDNGGTDALGSTTATGPDGIWNITVPALGDGNHALRVTLTDLAGTTSIPSDPLNIIINNTLPLATLGAVIGMRDDENSFNTFYADQTIDGSYTGTLLAGDKIQVSSDNGLSWHTAEIYTPGGFVDFSRVLTQSDTIVVRVVNDYASGSTVTQAYIYDPVATVVSVSAPAHAIDVAHPAGAYIVGETIPITLTFSEAVTLTNSASLNMGTYYYASYASGSGTTTLTFNYIVRVGTSTSDLRYADEWSLSGLIADGGGHQSNLKLPTPASLGAGGTAVVITAPVAGLSAPDLNDASDGGDSNRDDITNLSTLSFSGSGTGSHYTVALFDAATQVTTTQADDDGNWSFTDVTLTGDGPHQIVVRSYDYHYALSETSAPLGITINSAANVTMVAFSGDTGRDTNDFVTTTGTQTITVTTGPLASGDRVQVSLDNGSNWLDAIRYSDTSWYLAHGVNGAGTLLARTLSVNDVAGTAYSHAYLIDDAPPTASLSGSALTFDGDTGALTAVPTNSTTPTITVAMSGVTGLAGGDTIDLFDSANTSVRLGSYTVKASDLDGANWNGPASIEIAVTTATALGEGVHTIKARVGELASDATATGLSAAVQIKVDTTAPTLYDSTPAASGHYESGDDITLTFNENIALQSGAVITIENTGTAQTVATLSRDDVSVSLATITLSADTLSALAPGMHYRIDIADNSLTDIAGNLFADTVGVPELAFHTIPTI